jgi:hypothetical protein
MDVVSFAEDRVLSVRRWNGNSEVLTILNFSDQTIDRFRNIPFGEWHKRFDSADSRWMGTGATAPDVIAATPDGGLTLRPHGVLLYEKETED